MSESVLHYCLYGVFFGLGLILGIFIEQLSWSKHTNDILEALKHRSQTTP